MKKERASFTDIFLVLVAFGLSFSLLGLETQFGLVVGLAAVLTFNIRPTKWAWLTKIFNRNK